MIQRRGSVARGPVPIPSYLTSLQSKREKEGEEDGGGRGASKPVERGTRTRQVKIRRRGSKGRLAPRSESVRHDTRFDPDTFGIGKARSGRDAVRDGQAVLEGLVAVEQAPPALDTAELDVLPLLVKVLEEEVARAVGVRLADERVKEDL
jgi:hypothetical protein